MFNDFVHERKSEKNVENLGSRQSFCVLFVWSFWFLVGILVFSNIFIVAMRNRRGGRRPSVDNVLWGVSFISDNWSSSWNLWFFILEALLVGMGNGRLVWQKHRWSSEHVTERVIFKIQDCCSVEIRVSDNLEKQRDETKTKKEKMINCTISELWCRIYLTRKKRLTWTRAEKRSHHSIRQIHLVRHALNVTSHYGNVWLFFRTWI